MNGNEIVEPNAIVYEYGSAYETSAIDVNGYSLKSVPENAIGTAVEDVTVAYI